MNWTLHPLSALERLAPTWNELNQAAGALPFLDSRFLRSLCANFTSPHAQLAVSERDGTTIAMGILVRRAPARWETFQPSQLPVGAWVMRAGLETEPLLESLSQRLPGLALVVALTQQDPAWRPRPPDTARLTTLDYIETSCVPVAGTFHDYWQGRGKNLRHNMKRQRAKLAQQGLVTRLEIVTRAEDVASAIEDYGRIESAGWKSSSGTAIHWSNVQGRFYREMLESFCSVGRGRIFRYHIGGKVAAVDLCIEGGSALVILKTTYDESFEGLSPALLLLEDAFEAIFAEGKINRVEFYGKLLDWHRRWTSEVRMLYHVNFYRFPVLRKLKHALGAATPT